MPDLPRMRLQQLLIKEKSMEFLYASLSGMAGLLALDLLTLWQQKTETRRQRELNRQAGHLLRRVEPRHYQDEDRRAA